MNIAEIWKILPRDNMSQLIISFEVEEKPIPKTFINNHFSTEMRFKVFEIRYKSSELSY